mmetsp:Transcript_19265/g.64573  ORF Transcript_19265/g.64573 Transcript_19265/m.64573 type:complete len:270 (+) Transcript_19265:58-867(+)|eukprot:CAMPEP_0206017356 /NCGR_PEP_ID=MMETSP1464-20131121/24886_1 /ASSEMBLY_ACC=CAM_ASM_001124 /TAXON_ID=119497 /ORGANISM="Exanthemachrysis gayraliae, Strain RCC1523" /LENGTH=269 /DNA_ID=CAMNT_0053391203 /DNA_START=39 /DNA_END=848 /DNA_ORIENTATION=+
MADGPGKPSDLLTPAMAAEFCEAGFLLVPGLVDPQLLRRAHDFVSGAIRDGNTVEDHPPLWNLRPDLRSTECILDLYHRSHVPFLIEALMGPGLVGPVTRAQIAIRPPNAGDPLPHVPAGKRWHVDGFVNGQHSPFTVLVGVSLTDMSAPGKGNLAVHRHHHLRLHRLMAGEPGAPSNFALDASMPDRPDLGQPTVLCMHAGDVVVAHQKAPHCGTPNLSGESRCMVYFRVRHADHARLKSEWLHDPLLPFEGARRAAELLHHEQLPLL